MKDNLRELQLCELDILKYTIGVLEKLNLTYYVIAGTMLGAVRHHGFIPWDDDIDLGMPRPDYEKFIQLAEKELEAPYQLHTISTAGSEYSYYYIRVENKDIRLLRQATKQEVEIPAWIDIFPLDGAPDSERELAGIMKKIRRKRLLFRISQFDYFFSTTSTKKSRYSNLVVTGKKLISKSGIYKLINREKRWASLDKCMKTYDYESSSNIINYSSSYGSREYIPKAVFGAGKKYPFEDIMVNGPEDYDKYLTLVYGDYMTPPPEKDRDRHYIRMVSESDK